MRSTPLIGKIWKLDAWRQENVMLQFFAKMAFKIHTFTPQKSNENKIVLAQIGQTLRCNCPKPLKTCGTTALKCYPKTKKTQKNCKRCGTTKGGGSGLHCQIKLVGDASSTTLTLTIFPKIAKWARFALFWALCAKILWLPKNSRFARKGILNIF